MCDSTRRQIRLVQGGAGCKTGLGWAGLGCVKMFPWLVNVYMDQIVREAKKKVKLEERNVQFPLFSNGLMLVAEKEDVESNLRILDDVMAKWQMKINWGKTEAMVVKRGGGSCNVSVKDKWIE